MGLNADLAAAVDAAFAAADDLVTAMTIRRSTQGAYDQATGTQALTNTDYVTKGIMTKNERGTGTQEGGRPSVRVVINSSDITVAPKVNDHLITDGETYRVTRVVIAKPGTSNLVYKVDAEL